MFRSFTLFILLFVLPCTQKKSEYQVFSNKEIQSKGTIILDTSFVQKINESMPDCYIRLVEGEDSTADLDRYFYEININNDLNDSSSILLKGRTSINYTYYAVVPDVKIIEFIDLNFDTYRDIKMLSGFGANGINSGFDVYLYDPRKKTFIYSEQFSGILGGYDYYVSPFDSTIVSEGETGCLGHCYSRDIYKIIGDSIILISRTHKERDDSANSNRYILIEEVLINGDLKVIKQNTVDY